MNEDDPAEWRRRYWKVMDWQIYAGGNGGKCFVFPEPQSEAERQGQADLIRRDGRIFRFAVRWVSPEEFKAIGIEQHWRCHRLMGKWDPRRV